MYNWFTNVFGSTWPILSATILLTFLGINNLSWAQTKSNKASLVDTLDRMNRAKKYGVKISLKDSIPIGRDNAKKIKELIIKRWNKDDMSRVVNALDSIGIEKKLEYNNTMTYDDAVYRLAVMEGEFLKKNNIYVPTNIPAYNMLRDSLGAFKIDTLLLVKKLQSIRSYSTLQSLYLELERFIRFKEGSETYDRTNEQNLALISEQSQFISARAFSEYQFTETSKQILKGINISHDNDVFLFPGFNKDMNYTGGLKIELTTDLLKMRFLGNLFLSDKCFNHIKNICIIGFFAREIRRLKIDKLSYRSIYYGLEVYTPYLRFNSDGDPLTMNGSLFPAGERLNRLNSELHDRPYASLSYFGRSIYRMNKIGTVKMKGDFSVGMIGGSTGRWFQTTLHRDITINSPEPLGWENQIANGGRFTLNASETMDFMLISKRGDIFKHTEMLNYKERGSWPDWLNLHGSLEGRVGHQITSVGGGLALSSLNFNQRSGTEMFANKPGEKWNVFFSVSAKYRYVKHNSMLEGFGIFNTFESDGLGSQNERLSKWTIGHKMVNRNLFFGDVFLGLRTVKTVVFINWILNTREFRAEELITDSLTKKSQLFNTGKWYGFGRVGFNFLL